MYNFYIQTNHFAPIFLRHILTLTIMPNLLDYVVFFIKIRIHSFEVKLCS
jgi:hypothetical protein